MVIMVSMRLSDASSVPAPRWSDSGRSADVSWTAEIISGLPVVHASAVNLEPVLGHDQATALTFARLQGKLPRVLPGSPASQPATPRRGKGVTEPGHCHQHPRHMLLILRSTILFSAATAASGPAVFDPADPVVSPERAFDASPDD
jgi:hypothetical protein